MAQHRSSCRVRTLSGCLSGFALAASLLAAQAAQAQSDATPQGAVDEETASIVVTGTRIQASGFNAPTPITVLGAEQIERQAVTNVAQILNEIPAFRAQSSPSTSAIFVSNLGASTADLRGLGGNRTLVLIDGRRVVGSTVSGGSFTPANTVDLNLVPTSLLERAEVVTGGASAAYGSDAVAGVTNLILNRKLRGVKASVQYGLTERGDNREFQASLAGGAQIGRLSVVLGVEYVDNQGTGDCYTREWCAQSYNTVSNPFVTGSTTTRVIAGQPATLILPNARTATSSLNGLVIAGPLRGTEFRADGTTYAHDYGVYGSGLFQSGGGDPILPFYQFFPLSAPSKRANAFANIDYEVTDTLKLTAQGSYGFVKGEVLGASRRDVSPAGSYQIQRDNAFLPASVVTRMIGANVTSLPFGRIWNDLGPQIGSVTRETKRFVAGFEWGFTSKLTLEGYYQFGQTDYSQRGYNTTVNSRMAFAIDSVRDPISGNIVCRATLPGAAFRAAAAGCVPLNPFGSGASSAAARQYVTATAMQDTTLKQHVFSLTLRGDLVELWAGPLSFAAGGEYRKDSVASTVDPISAANDFHTSPGGGITGNKRSINVKEGFVELALPLAKDLPFAKSLGLNGAVRVTDYSFSGSVETWKAGADWEPTDFLRFRGTRSRDIRAPNLFELYGAPQSSFQTVDDPANGGARALIPTLLSGNTALVPEIADTWTAGAVVTARMGDLGTLRVSADWFDISLNGAISTLGAQIIVTRCYQGNAALCQYVTRNGAGQLTQIINANLNLNKQITRGWDFEADYNVPLGSGKLNVRALATVLKDLITVDTAGVAIDRAGQNGSGVSQPSGLPRYTINAMVGYSGGPFGAQVQIRHISSGRYQVTNIGPDEAGYSPLLANSINNNRVPAVTYVNLNAQFKIRENIELFGVVSNLFDKDPPNYLPSSFGATNPVLYDVLGRSFKFGIRASL